MHAFFKYAVPTALVASLSGFFVGSTMNPGSATGHASKKAPSLRDTFLSGNVDHGAEVGDFDYQRLARACLSAARQSPESDTLSTVARSEPHLDADPAVVEESKKQLDQVMEVSLERGVWSRGAGMRARHTLRRLSVTDAANFRRLLWASLDNGGMRVSPGAWVPERMN